MIPTLRYAHLVPHVWSQLENEERKGWVRSGIKNPETVAEHTCDLLRLADEVAHETGMSDRDRADLLSMLEVHDWPEAVDGDEITLHGVDHKKEADQRQRKHERERRTMETLCAPVGAVGQEIFAYWLRFETSDDSVAILARELDKYQAIEKAFTYEREGGPLGLGEEFVSYSPSLTHPVLRKWSARLRDEQKSRI